MLYCDFLQKVKLQLRLNRKWKYLCLLLVCIHTKCFRDFLGRLAVKTLPSNAVDAGSIPGWGAKILYVSQPEKQNIKNNRTNTVTNSIKTFKMWTLVHIQKKNLPKKMIQKIQRGDLAYLNLQTKPSYANHLQVCAS